MSSLWEKIVRPTLFALDAESAHDLGMRALESGFSAPFKREVEHIFPSSIERFGCIFRSPIGMAAGFDKNGRVVGQLASLGFGFVEVGTVTARPQPGNPKPRMFRLPEDRAIINRLGFNNDGADVVAARLAKIKRKCVVGVNIGKNKDVPNEEAVANYLEAFEKVFPYADYIAVNVSSPNTPNLRELQKPEQLSSLVEAMQNKNAELSGSGPLKPLLLKIAPDLDERGLEATVDVCLSGGVAGIIATNTTVSREGLVTGDVASFGDGGVSGKPLRERSNKVISAIYRKAGSRLPIVGVGGVFTGDDAFEKIASGASLVQAYTGFVYGGPSFAYDVCRRLAEIMAQRGFKTLDEAVGSGLRTG